MLIPTPNKSNNAYGSDAQVRLFSRRYVDTKILVVFSLVVFTSTLTATAETGGSCDARHTNEPTVIHIPDPYCTTNEACGVTFTLDKNVGDLEFQTLRIRKEISPTVGLALFTEEVGTLISTNMFADHNFFDGLVVYAQYSDLVVCEMFTMIKLKYDQEGEKLDILPLNQWFEWIK